MMSTARTVSELSAARVKVLRLVGVANLSKDSSQRWKGHNLTDPNTATAPEDFLEQSATVSQTSE